MKQTAASEAEVKDTTKPGVSPCGISRGHMPPAWNESESYIHDECLIIQKKNTMIQSGLARFEYWHCKYTENLVI